MSKIFSLLLFVISYAVFVESNVVARENLPTSYDSQTGQVRVRRQIDCASNGHFPDRPPEMCSMMYFSCSNTAGKWEKRWFSCGRGKHYDPSSPTKCTAGPCVKKAKVVTPEKAEDEDSAEAPTTQEAETTTEATTTIAPLRPLAATDILFSSNKLNWENAMAYCVKAKATLLVIEEEEDNLFLNSAASFKKAPHLAKESVWSAAKFPNTEYEKLYWEPEHEKIENFKKKKAMTLKINWGVGEPNDEEEKGEDLCVDIKFSGNEKTLPVWAASNCKDIKHFICIRKGEDRRHRPKEDEEPLEDPISGFPGSLTIRGVDAAEEKGIKLAGQLLMSNRSDYYYFYPEKRKLIPSPLLNENDDPYQATYKPGKSPMALRAIDTLAIKTNGTVLPTSGNKCVVFIPDGKFVSGVFQPDPGAMSVTAVISSLEGYLLLTPERNIEFLAYDWHEIFNGPTAGKWKPRKISEFGDKPWANSGHGTMKPQKNEQILWKPDEPVTIPAVV